MSKSFIVIYITKFYQSSHVSNVSSLAKGFGPLCYQNPGSAPTTFGWWSWSLVALPVSQCWPVHPVFYLYRSADQSIPCFTCIAVLTSPSRVLPVSQCWPVHPVFYLYRSADQSIPCFTCIAVLTSPSPVTGTRVTSDCVVTGTMIARLSNAFINICFTRNQNHISIEAGHAVISITYSSNIIILKY